MSAAPSINTVAISGTINGDTREAQVGDTHVVETELAFMVPGKDGPKEQWVQLQGWGNIGDALALIPEGSEVIVNGSLNRRSWKDKEDNWQSRYSIRVLQIQELGGPHPGPEKAEAADDELPFD